MSVILKPDPLGVPRSPLAVYLLVLTVVSGLVTLLGATTSGAVAEQLPGLAARIWGALLTVGGGFTLLGMYWQGLVTTGLLLKRMGMFVMVVTTAIYAVAVVATAGLQGAYVAGLIAGYSVACAVQYHALDARVRAIVEATKQGTTVVIRP